MRREIVSRLYRLGCRIVLDGKSTSIVEQHVITSCFSGQFCSPNSSCSLLLKQAFSTAKSGFRSVPSHCSSNTSPNLSLHLIGSKQETSLLNNLAARSNCKAFVHHRSYWTYRSLDKIVGNSFGGRFSDKFHNQWKIAAKAIRPSAERILRIGDGYNARVFIINALYAAQTSSHWTRLLSLLMAEAVTRGDPLAWCYDVPVTEKEVEMLVEAERAEAAAADSARNFWKIALGWISSVFRFFVLLMIFSPVVASAFFALRRDKTRKQWLHLLRRTLEMAGPAFIKWGQWAATRADLFPPDVCDELSKLHSSAPAHEFSYTEKAIKDAFGFTLVELFDEFEEQPVASGSIGQIHRASVSAVGSRLTGVKEGTTVAVKVRHPGVTESIERDFALMMMAANLANFIPALKSLRLSESLKQFAAPLREQVDLSREAYNLHEFNYNFRSEDRVTFPIPVYPLVASNVLVETYEDGNHISEYVERGAGAPFNSDLACIGARTMLHMFIVDNLVHADLHPGNILVRLNPYGGVFGEKFFDTLKGAVSSLNNAFNLSLAIPEDRIFKPSIVLLDAGMATRLSSEDQINMVGLFEAFSRLDGRSVADWTLRFAGENQTCPDPAAFRQDMINHFDDLYEIASVNDTSNGAEMLAAVLETVRQHQVSLPGHICAAVVTTLVLEGWSHQLDPAHSTLSEVKRVIALKKNETKLRKIAQWVQGAAVDREIYDHMPAFAPDGGLARHGIRR